MKMAVGDTTGRLEIIDIEKKKSVIKLPSHMHRINCLDWHGRILASGSRDGFISVWDIRVPKKLHVYKAHEKDVSGLKWNYNGRYLASGGNDRKASLFDFGGRRLLYKFGNHKGAVKAMDWCPNN